MALVTHRKMKLNYCKTSGTKNLHVLWMCRSRSLGCVKWETSSQMELISWSQRKTKKSMCTWFARWRWQVRLLLFHQNFIWNVNTIFKWQLLLVQYMKYAPGGSSLKRIKCCSTVMKVFQEDGWSIIRSVIQLLLISKAVNSQLISLKKKYKKFINWKGPRIN